MDQRNRFAQLQRMVLRSVLLYSIFAIIVLTIVFQLSSTWHCSVVDKRLPNMCQLLEFLVMFAFVMAMLKIVRPAYIEIEKYKSRHRNRKR